MHADLAIYLAVVAALGVAYMIRRHLRQARKPRLGDADAYEGNVLILPAGHQRARHGIPTSHAGHHIGHSGHFGGHDAGTGHVHHS